MKGRWWYRKWVAKSSASASAVNNEPPPPASPFFSAASMLCRHASSSREISAGVATSPVTGDSGIGYGSGGSGNRTYPTTRSSDSHLYAWDSACEPTHGRTHQATVHVGGRVCGGPPVLEEVRRLRRSRRGHGAQRGKP